MKAWRSLCPHVHLFCHRTKQIQSTTFAFVAEGSGLGSELTKDPCISTDTRDGEESENISRVWSTYNPILVEMAKPPGINESTNGEVESRIPSSANKIEDSYTKMTERVENPSEIRETHAYSYNSSKATEQLLVDSISSNLEEENELSSEAKSDYDAEKGSIMEEKSRMGLLNYNTNGYLSNEKQHGSSQQVESSSEVDFQGVPVIQRKQKVKSIWVCQNCGRVDGKWWGSCRGCNAVGTMAQLLEEVSRNGHKGGAAQFSGNVAQSWLPQLAAYGKPLSLAEVNQATDHLNWRIPLSGLFGNEVTRVLGGGLVPGSLVLISGDPGVGKSTLLLQVAALISDGNDSGKSSPVMYVSGEESVEQIGSRAIRMGITSEKIFLYSSTDVEDILKKAQVLCPRALFVDSIQTTYLRGIGGTAGGLNQVKECAAAFLRFAKATNVPVILIGHVNKTGDIAGPHVLEHIVDVVLHMEGEKTSSCRLFRAMKNRFGCTDELGVFEMSATGLRGVPNPSGIFLSEHHADPDILVGIAITVIIDGNKSFLIEIQALAAPGTSRTRVNGISESKVEMIISVLIKQAGLVLQNNAIFVNVVGGMKLKETAGDLAIAITICSSCLEVPIPNNMAFIGEIGLAGELRSVRRMEKRVSTVSQLGYHWCVVPKSAEDTLLEIGFGQTKIIGCKSLKEVIKFVFEDHKQANGA